MRMSCMICMSFPEVSINARNPKVWHQVGDFKRVPSNRMCVHIRHLLTCPTCDATTMSLQEEREMFHIDEDFKRKVLERDDYTCQACGYKPKGKPFRPSRKASWETSENYFNRLFDASMDSSNNYRSLVVAHYHGRYEKETHEDRHKLENARTLCEDCHNTETALHQMKSWLKRSETCPILKELE